jgi:hypothetical protein
MHFFSAVNKYISATLLYGFVRASTYASRTEHYYFNSKTDAYEKKEMLLVDKIGRITGDTAVAIVLWPVMLGQDLAFLECKARGKDPAAYNHFRK